jgi:transposase
MEKSAELRQGALGPMGPGEEPMLSQDQWGAIGSLSARGLGVKRIARALGVAARTVRRYLRQGGRRVYQRACPVRDVLERDHGEYLRRRAPEVNFCAQVLFQEIRAQGYPHGYASVMRWVRPLREEERRLEAATVRFETGPGKQAQADWGSTRVVIAGRPERVHLFVLTLGFSRRLYARAYADERLVSLLDAHERAFAHFGGRTEEVLYDNPRTIVLRRDAEGKHIEWNPLFRDFADYYGITPRLCRPYRARTKGKVESGVKYVKRNALAGRAFPSWEALNAWLEEWVTTIADERLHGTTHERPCERFTRETLHPVAGVPPYHLVRHPLRRVASDCLVNLETNRYSVPWRLVGERVEVAIVQGRVRVFHRGALVAEHLLGAGRHQVIRDAEHYRGLFRQEPRSPAAALPPMPALLWPLAWPEVQVRELSVYEALAEAGGAP